MKRRGFTLIELLVVIAIIAILAAILFPVFAKAREKARQSSCSSNEKQLALAVLQYAQDFDEVFPYYSLPVTPNIADPVTGYSCNRVSYALMIQPYAKSWQMFICPSSRRGATNTDCCSRQSVTWSYGPNHTYWTGEPAVCNGNAMATYAVPAMTIMLGEQSGTQHQCGGEFITGKNGWPAVLPADWSEQNNGCVLHNDGGNYAFYDGHVKWIKMPEARNWSMYQH